MTVFGALRETVFGIPSAAAVGNRRGFTPEALTHFEPVANALIAGYNGTLRDPRFPAITDKVAAVDPVLRGFAYEGVGMGLAVLDTLSPGRPRLPDFVAGPGKRHVALLYIGAGLAYARMRRFPEAAVGGLDRVLGWFAVDGYGFHEAFFHWANTVERHRVPSRLSAYGAQVFDQGVGRALWFTSGTDVERVARLIAAYPADRHGDLWSGAAAACAYAGGADAGLVAALLDLAPDHRRRMAGGVAMAAFGRELAGNQAGHTDLACKVIAEHSAEETARIADLAYRAASPLSVAPAHQIWRARIDDELAVVHSEGK
ncbi:DUF1702 family protein [Nocardia rhizosphaerae]|uniref:DUF1702 family protein n=1 Tax=Nocardia rhizosphaerae TaxID=1691571 RepID=A0ABV8LC58_9NOCA